MNYLKLRLIDKLYFGYEEIARALGISLKSAAVSANRYVRQGFLIRAKRNIYVLRERWEAAAKEEAFTIANILEVPSYISLMTAMDYYDVTTQIQRNFVESIAIKRTKETVIDNTVFDFRRIDKRLYFGFLREKGFFIASPEKAFLDAVYLKSIKRYDFDLTSIDFGKLDKTKLKLIGKSFPAKTREAMKRYGYLK